MKTLESFVEGTIERIESDVVKIDGELLKFKSEVFPYINDCKVGDTVFFKHNGEVITWLTKKEENGITDKLKTIEHFVAKDYNENGEMTKMIFEKLCYIEKKIDKICKKLSIPYENDYEMEITHDKKD